MHTCIIYNLCLRLHIVLKLLMNKIRPTTCPISHVCMSRPPLRQIQVASTRPSCNFTQQEKRDIEMAHLSMLGCTHATWLRIYIRFTCLFHNAFKEIDLRKALGKSVHGINQLESAFSPVTNRNPNAKETPIQQKAPEGV